VAGVRIATPAKLNVKTEPRLACSLVFTILLVSVDCCFFAFFGVFSSDFGLLYRRSKPDFLLFLNYFLSVGLPSAKPVGSLQLRFPVGQTSSYVSAPDQSKVVL